MKIKGTIFEELLREAAKICIEEAEKYFAARKCPLMNESKPQPQGPRLIPVNKWNDYHPYPAKEGLRHLIFNAKENGFERCIRRIGRSVLIHEEEFFKWVDERSKI